MLLREIPEDREVMPESGHDIAEWRTPNGRRAALRGRAARSGLFPTYSPAFFSLIAASSFLMSSGDSFGRSIVSVTLFSLPVKAKGTL